MKQLLLGSAIAACASLLFPASGNGAIINVKINGRIIVRNANGIFHQGVPGVQVGFDWNYDNDPGSTWNPHYLDGSNYTITDANGNYSFIRQVAAGDADDPIWNIKAIRVFAQISNEAAYDGSLGSEAIFSDMMEFGISISPSRPDIDTIVGSIDVNQNQGNALRYLWRARRFAVEQFGFHPPPIGFTFESDAPVSYFFSGYWGGVQWYPPGIRFNSIPESETGYHEYGHYVHFFHNKARYINNTGWSGTHSWYQRTDDGMAFREGWAEFYCAAAHTWWYSRENPAARESEYGNATYYQFPDHAQNTLPSNKGDCEGGVATFLYNLWDDIAPRIPGAVPKYRGDNEDLGQPFGYPARLLLSATAHALVTERRGTVNDPYTVRRVPYINVYRYNGYLPAVNMLYPKTFWYHQNSINAMYDFLTSDARLQRSATPAKLTVTSDNPPMYRDITWIDTTGPSDIVYNPEAGMGAGSITLYRNNEAEFSIWRKKVETTPWVWNMMDGKLDGEYQEIARVGQDVETYRDETPLQPGLYSYVVTARNYLYPGVFNAYARSIPKAEATIEVGKYVSVKRRGTFKRCDPIESIVPGGTGGWIATTNGASPTYRWIVENAPPFLSIAGIDSDTLTITNNYTAGVQFAENPGFNIRCVVDHASGRDTSARIYPSYTPLDRAGMFVSVRASGDFVVDSNAGRGLEILTDPGHEIISVHPLRVAPLRDSSGYKILLRAPAGTPASFNSARLLVVEHPPGTELGGSGDCGFIINRRAGAELIPDSTYSYGLHELPLKVAQHLRLGTMTDYMREHDSLYVPLHPRDSVMLIFDDPITQDSVVEIDDSLAVADSSRAGWIRDYVLELSGASVGTQGGISPIVLPSTVDAERGMRMELEQNTPNPASGIVTIRYRLEKGAATLFQLYTVDGRLIKTVIDEYRQRGSYLLSTDVSALPSGVYYYRLVSGGETRMRMMTVVR